VANRPAPHARPAARNIERLCPGKQENLRTTSDATKEKMNRVQHSGTLLQFQVLSTPARALGPETLNLERTCNDLVNQPYALTDGGPA
jgi:hypothetical protein